MTASAICARESVKTILGLLYPNNMRAEKQNKTKKIISQIETVYINKQRWFMLIRNEPPHYQVYISINTTAIPAPVREVGYFWYAVVDLST